MTCPTCGCDPEDPWYDPCDNEDCPCGQAGDEEDEECE